MMIQGLNSDGEELHSVYVVHDPWMTEVADDGMTRQEFKDECDINVLMATYERTGIISHINPMSPQYLDVTDVPDLQRALAVVDAAETAFMTLPASVRREFDNDPLKFVEFAGEPANLERMRGWGLAAPAPVVETVSVPGADPSKVQPAGSPEAS